MSELNPYEPDQSALEQSEPGNRLRRTQIVCIVVFILSIGAAFFGAQVIKAAASDLESMTADRQIQDQLQSIRRITWISVALLSVTVVSGLATIVSTFHLDWKKRTAKRANKKIAS